MTTILNTNNENENTISLKYPSELPARLYRDRVPAVVSLLLEKNPSDVDQEGLTALPLACKEESTDIAFQLIAAGAYVGGTSSSPARKAADP